MAELRQMRVEHETFGTLVFDPLTAEAKASLLALLAHPPRVSFLRDISRKDGRDQEEADFHRRFGSRSKVVEGHVGLIERRPRATFTPAETARRAVLFARIETSMLGDSTHIDVGRLPEACENWHTDVLEFICRLKCWRVSHRPAVGGGDVAQLEQSTRELAAIFDRLDATGSLVAPHTARTQVHADAAGWVYVTAKACYIDLSRRGLIDYVAEHPLEVSWLADAYRQVIDRPGSSALYGPLHLVYVGYTAQADNGHTLIDRHEIGNTLWNVLRRSDAIFSVGAAGGSIRASLHTVFLPVDKRLRILTDSCASRRVESAMQAYLRTDRAYIGGTTSAGGSMAFKRHLADARYIYGDRVGLADAVEVIAPDPDPAGDVYRGPARILDQLVRDCGRDRDDVGAASAMETKRWCGWKPRERKMGKRKGRRPAQSR